MEQHLASTHSEGEVLRMPPIENRLNYRVDYFPCPRCKTSYVREIDSLNCNLCVPLDPIFDVQLSSDVKPSTSTLPPSTDDLDSISERETDIFIHTFANPEPPIDNMEVIVSPPQLSDLGFQEIGNQNSSSPKIKMELPDEVETDAPIIDENELNPNLLSDDYVCHFCKEEGRSAAYYHMLYGCSLAHYDQLDLVD